MYVRIVEENNKYYTEYATTKDTVLFGLLIPFWFVASIFSFLVSNETERNEELKLPFNCLELRWKPISLYYGKTSPTSFDNLENALIYVTEFQAVVEASRVRKTTIWSDKF